MHENKRQLTSIERFLLHIHPPKVDERVIVFSNTFGLGGISVLLFLLLVVSGLLLRFTYIPTPEKAYDSIVLLQNQVLFGRLVRNIHHIAATLLLVTSFLHLALVYFKQAIFGARAKNWIYGLIIMSLVLFMNFTGYLLPWDQLAYWAVTIMTGMLEYIPLLGKPMANMFRGGDIVDGTTLIIFYNLHTGVLPLLMVFLLSIHFWLVRKAKGIALKKTENQKMVSTSTYLVSKEVIAALIVLIVVFAFSIFYNAPLLDKASTTISPNPSKAPWYFMGVQEFLLHVHPVVAVFVIPVVTIIIFARIPYWKYNTINVGVLFNSDNGKQLVLSTAIYTFLLSVILILISELWLKGSERYNSLPQFLSGGTIPLLMYFVPQAIFFFFYNVKKKPGKLEWIMGLMTAIIVSYFVMMIIGIWFRGEGMNFVFPF